MRGVHVYTWLCIRKFVLQGNYRKLNTTLWNGSNNSNKKL